MKDNRKSRKRFKLLFKRFLRVMVNDGAIIKGSVNKLNFRAGIPHVKYSMQPVPAPDFIRLEINLQPNE